MSLCPKDRPEAFYLNSLKRYDTNCWFAKAPVGVHTLEKMVSGICLEAGFQGVRTNHSLRATAASRLYQKGVDEQLIQEVTGHRSNAVRSYKRTNDCMKQNISSILSGEGPCTKKSYSMSKASATVTPST